MFRLRRMHEMHTIVTLPMIAVSVCLSVCHAAQLGFTVQKWLNGSRSCLGWTTPGGLSNIVLDGGPDPSTARGGGFDAAFAKLLWPLVKIVSLLK